MQLTCITPNIQTVVYTQLVIYNTTCVNVMRAIIVIQFTYFDVAASEKIKNYKFKKLKLNFMLFNESNFNFTNFF